MDTFSERRAIRLIPMLSGVAALVLVLASALSFLGTWHWSFELLSQFRVQFFFASLIGLMIFLGLRFRAPAIALGLLALAHLIPVLMHMSRSGAIRPPAAADGDVAVLSLVYLNMHHRTSDHEAFLAHVRARKPDLVVLTEVDPARRETLFAQLDRQYPHRLETDEKGPFDMTVFSAHSLRKSRALPDPESGWPMVHAAVCPDGFERCAELIAVHAPRPGRKWTRLRNRVFAEVAVRARAGQAPVIVVGDFNCTPWSPAFRRMLRQGQLRDGGGLMAALSPTWVSRVPPFGLGIDHVLTGRGMFETRRRIGPAFGSDHFSIRARLLADLGTLAPSPGGS